MTLRELADRAEKGAGNDLELNCFVAAALGWVAYTYGNKVSHWRDQDGATHTNIPDFSGSIDAARTLLPWKPHPRAEFKTRLINDGNRGFYSFVEFCWPSTETQARARDEARATLACALRAIERTNEELAPYRKPEGKRA